MRRFVFLLAIAAALMAPAAASAAERTVSVQATVERAVPNDAARVHFTVSKERQGRAAALRVVAARLRAVIAAAQATPGVGPGDVTTGSISVRRVKRGKSPVYRASESVTVITHDPGAAGDLVAAGVAAGATSTRGPNFFVGNREAAYNAALVEAFAQAKRRRSCWPRRRAPRSAPRSRSPRAAAWSPSPHRQPRTWLQASKRRPRPRPSPAARPSRRRSQRPSRCSNHRRGRRNRRARAPRRALSHLEVAGRGPSHLPEVGRYMPLLRVVAN